MSIVMFKLNRVENSVFNYFDSLMTANTKKVANDDK